ncbi:segregation and condensation protein A [Methanococcus voltae]|uniref:Segregation and condensation protein A n=2 Tax=Methanococcus voltae TaxID=2188 RepID=A0A8J7S3K1_METVO|nr:segregation/condensation protein A [Methanococcus voltae]MBP2200793.1 segregation and condensation protein A [Methanococcus voltae]MCS3921517.1 segregation and condensation protein A [Methanococcus voltae PS]
MEFELWVRIIKENISKKQVDPWNINISDIANEYLETIKELRKFDIRLSADVVLVASILLRMKSEILYGECENAFDDEEEDEVVNEDDRMDEDYNDLETQPIPILTDPKTNENSTKQTTVTLDGLITTLQSELNKIKSKKPRKKRTQSPSTIATNLNNLIEEMVEEDDISDIMDYIIEELGNSKDGNFIFQEKFDTREKVIKNFLPSLYLANDGKIDLLQEELFEELYVQLKSKQ